MSECVAAVERAVRSGVGSCTSNGCDVTRRTWPPVLPTLFLTARFSRVCSSRQEEEDVPALTGDRGAQGGSSGGARAGAGASAAGTHAGCAGPHPAPPRRGPKTQPEKKNEAVARMLAGASGGNGAVQQVPCPPGKGFYDTYSGTKFSRALDGNGQPIWYMGRAPGAKQDEPYARFKHSGTSIEFSVRGTAQDEALSA